MQMISFGHRTLLIQDYYNSVEFRLKIMRVCDGFIISRFEVPLHIQILQMAVLMFD